MSVLPSSGVVDLEAGLQFEQQPSLTWYIDQMSGRIRGTVSGYEAVKQAVDIILHVERFRWQIYSPYSGMQWDGLIGQDPGYVASEIQRRLEDALGVDDRIRGISGFTYVLAGDTMTASMTVHTVYGDIPTSVEVNLA